MNAQMPSNVQTTPSAAAGQTWTRRAAAT
jgi:hypothetical protein